MAMNKPLVIVVGGTGITAQYVFDALLATDAFRVAALVRPASQAKPAVEALRSRGVVIRVADVTQDSVETLETCLTGVDILVSVMAAMVVLKQKNLMTAAKKAGVGRVVPSEFASPCPPGRRDLHDEKLAMRAFIRNLGIPYTIVDIGWWMQLALPHRNNSPAPPNLIAWSHERVGTDAVKIAVTSNADIGRFVARIIADPRTLNQHVFCWSEEVTLNEVYALADRVSGEKLSDLIVEVSAEELFKRAADAKAQWNETFTEGAHIAWSYAQYIYSLYGCGDNTLEKAKAVGALDAKELYPDFKPATLEECAKQFYA